MLFQQRQSAPKSTSRMLAIVVDDDAFVRATICARLAKMNIAAEEFGNVEESVDFVQNNPFDFAIVDLGLPDGTGHEIITAIRNSERNSDAPVIIVTADQSDRTYMEGLGHDRAMFVSQKPIDWDCLNCVLEGTILN